MINPYLNNPEMQKLNEIIGYIDNYYLDTVQKDLLYQDAINGMLQALDPHSVYINAEENKQLSESLNGAFEGVGIQFNIMNDTVMVVATVHGGPSEKVGIRAGDRIVSVDGKSVAGNGIKNEEVFKILRGKKNTTVKIGIKRPSFSQIYFYNVIRDVIPTYTVDVSYMIDNQIGYIKINQFGENTYNEFMSAIYSLRKQGLQSLILDLRGNPGGYLNTAIDICDELLPNKEMIVYTEGLKVPSNQIFATKRGSFEKGKLVVLIDDFSASASEIVAGAVQDNDRGWVVGRRSFGKGLVQQQFDLSDKSSLRL
ncbi:MAG: S41 family peptidase, partial [Bacteroidales bacterium]|nr:S41 family peptidase [Bacteroidales bacterium]